MTRRKILAGIMLLSLACGGCFTRTVYVPDGAPVRIRKAIKNCPIWARDASGKWIEGKLDIPEGWYALPDPGEYDDSTD